MADKETPVIEKPDYESTKPQNPLSSIISKFTEIFNFRFPPPPVRKKIQSESKSSVVEEDESKAVIVRFPDAHVVQPLKLQAQELERDTNPVFLWQVCFMLKSSPDQIFIYLFIYICDYKIQGVNVKLIKDLKLILSF